MSSDDNVEDKFCSLCGKLFYLGGNKCFVWTGNDSIPTECLVSNAIESKLFYNCPQMEP